MLEKSKIILDVLGGNIIDNLTGEVIINPTELKKIIGQDIEVIETTTGQLAIGISQPTTLTSPRDYLKDMDEYKFVKSDIYRQMDVCDKLYRYEGVVGTVIDTLVDISNTEILLQDLEDEKAIKVLNYFRKNLNKKLQVSPTGLKSFIDQGMSNWFVFGNVFPYKSWRKVKIENETYELPNIMFLNPQAIEIDEGLLPIGIEKVYLKLTNDILKRAKTQTSDFKLLDNGNLKPDKNGRIALDPSNITHIKRKSRDWEGWGIPYLVRAFSAITSKKRLRKLDDATTEGLINYLTIFKIGSPDKESPYHKVSLGRLQAFANLIKNPTASTTLVWPHDITVETVGPDNKVLSFKEKYAEVDADILKSLGIGAKILEPTSTRLGEESILLLIETLETVRGHFIVYLTELFEEILERNNIKADPYKIRFTNVKLSDILQKLKSLILSYYDRGLLSYETALTLGGHDFKQETDRKKKEKPLRKEEMFAPPNLPFSTQKQETPMTRRDDGRPSDKMRTEKVKIDNDVNLNKPTKNIGEVQADQAYVDIFYQGLTNKYDRLKDNLVDEIQGMPKYNQGKLDLIINAGFIGMKNYMKDGLRIIYETYNSEDFLTELFNNEKAKKKEPNQDLMYQKLIGWNEFYMNKFRDKISTDIHKGAGLLEGADVDLMIPLIVTAFEMERYRLNIYAEEGFYKAQLAGTLEAKAREGAIGGYWLTAGDDKVCDACESREGNWYKMDEIFDVHPGHPNCRCEFEWTTENPLLADPEKNNETVIVNPSNPNKPL